MDKGKDYLARIGPATPKRRLRLRGVFNDTLVAVMAVVAACLVLAFGGLVLTWLLWHDRYHVGLLDYLMQVVF